MIKPTQEQALAELELLYKATRQLQGTAEGHERMKIAMINVSKYIQNEKTDSVDSPVVPNPAG